MTKEEKMKTEFAYHAGSILKSMCELADEAFELKALHFDDEENDSEEYGKYRDAERKIYDIINSLIEVRETAKGE